jgi:hypothetical protein
MARCSRRLRHAYVLPVMLRVHFELTITAYAAINDVQDTLNHEHGMFLHRRQIAYHGC